MFSDSLWLDVSQVHPRWAPHQGVKPTQQVLMKCGVSTRFVIVCILKLVYSSLLQSRQAHPIDHSPPSRSRPAHPDPSRAIPPSTTFYEGSRAYVSRTRSSEYTNKREMRPEGSSHSFDLFIASDQGLVHQRSSKRDDLSKVSKEESISLSTGKHLCPECGRRFEKRSHLKVKVPHPVRSCLV
jgi:hypothetical protein